MFGRATITLGIGPHSRFNLIHQKPPSVDEFTVILLATVGRCYVHLSPIFSLSREL